LPIPLIFNIKKRIGNITFDKNKEMSSIFEKITDAQKSGKTCALCTITKTEGSTPRKAGSKMLVYKDLQIEGSIGGGALESECIKNAQAVLMSNKPQLFVHQLEKDHQMSCGGFVEIFIEPLNIQKKLYIFGGGHVGKALSEFATLLNFQVTVIDSRKEIIENYANKNIKTLNLDIKSAFEILPFDEHVFICTATHEHSGDREVIMNALTKKYCYLGMIGSTRKVAKTKQILQENGFSNQQINSIDMPMGIAIKCETPEEIAISIVAKLIDVRLSI